MSHITSESDNIADFFRRKNLAVVPRDQNELLAQSDAWAVELKNTRYGLINVPAHVLDSVKSSYLASKDGQKQSDEGASTNDNPKEVSSKPSNAPPSSSAHASSPERQLEWSQSPKRPSEPSRQPDMSAPSVVHETPYVQHQRQDSLPRRTETIQRAVIYEPASSNDVEELEMHVPEGERNEVPASYASTSNVSASIASAQSQARDDSPQDEYDESDGQHEVRTPPCAQPDEQIIPGTVTVESTKTSTAANQRRQRVMKPISFSQRSPRKRHENAASRRMQSIRHFDTMQTQESLISSSVIPATARESLTQLSSAEKKHLVVQNPQVSWESYTQEEISGDEEQTEGEAPSNETGDEEETAEKAPHSKQDMTVQDPPAAVKLKGPFDRFQSAYLDYTTSYSGSLIKFIKACVCLEYLQRERALRECMYDDFIRAFSGGYLSYVAKAGSGREPLPAIEWFNIQRGPILYGKMIITQDSLKSVLELHQGEVTRVRSLILGAEEAGRLRREEEQVSEVDKSTVIESEPMDVDDPDPGAQATPPPQTPQRTQPAPALKPATQVSRQSSPPLTATPIFRSPLSGGIQKPSPQVKQRISARGSSGSPASTARSAPLASQYMQQLASRRSSSNTEAETERSSKLIEFLRKRKSGSIGSSSSGRVASAER
jgi:hypothetical protein